MLKKLSAFILAVTLAATTLTACGKSSDSSTADDAADVSLTDSTADSTADTSTADSSVPDASLTIDDKTVDTSNLVMMTIDGNDITFDMFRYYYYYVLSTYGLTADQVTEDLFPNILEYTVNSIKQEYVAVKLASENDIALSDDDNTTIETNITDLKAKYEDEDTYQQALHDYYLTEDLYKQMLELSTLYSKVEDTLLTNGGKYATSEDDFKEIVQDTDKYARAIHILIPYSCTVELSDSDAEGYDDLDLSSKLSAKEAAYEALDEDGQTAAKADAKKLAEEVLQKVADGEDFQSLIDEYGWDPGMESDDYKDGYYFNKDSSFVQEFKDATFELGENETTSELVESSDYGWFIIKRLPVDMDYVNDNLSTMIEDYDSPKIQDMYTEQMEAMEVTYSDEYNGLKFDSIT